jgi:hypothetical protein
MPHPRSQAPLQFSPAPHPIPVRRPHTSVRSLPSPSQRRARLVALVLSPRAASLRRDLDAELVSALDEAVALEERARPRLRA